MSYEPPRLRELTVRRCETKGRWRVFLGKKHPWANASGWQWRYRLLVQLLLGRPLDLIEQVDHVNGNREDDRPENLRVYLMRKTWNHHFWNSTMRLVAEWVPGLGFYEYDEPQELEVPF